MDDTKKLYATAEFEHGTTVTSEVFSVEHV